MNRRRFLASTAAAAGLHPLLETFAAQAATGTAMPKRPLGRTGVNVSIIGIGGYDLSMPREERVASRIMDKAIDLGVNFFDNAWAYAGGVSEERMGGVISEPSKRQKVFVMTKVIARDATGAQKQLEDSLRRLRTDVIDLWQFHEMKEMAEIDRIFGPGGAMEVAQKAKKDGKIRFVGFTGHTSPQVHLAMLDRFDWDTVMMPINPADAHWNSFQNQVLPRALERKFGVIAFKSLSRGRALARAYTVGESLRYVWSLPVSVLVSGMDRTEFADTNLDMAMKFEPMSKAEKQALLNRIKPLAGSEIEYYKKA